MNAAKNQQTEHTIKYPVAHIKRQGVDLVIVLLNAAFGNLGPMEKAKVLGGLQQHATAAGLRGAVVPIWDNGKGAAEFLAERQLLPCLKNLTLASVHANINRELIVKAVAPVVAGPASFGNNLSHLAPPEHHGTVSIVGEIEDCQVFVDGAFVGHIPAKQRLKEGNHTIEVRKAGFRPYKQDVEVTGGSEIHLRPILEGNDLLSAPSSGGSNLQSALDQRGKVQEFQRKHRVGLITLLFTDMVGSTKLKQELGDHEAVALIQRHHRVVRDILSRFPSGQEISTAGDSFFLAFAKPSDAVKFSLQLQSKLREVAQGSARPLLDRIGIHVGEVFIEEEGGPGKARDLYGIQVDTCARVMSLGEGDQILMTRFAFDNAKQVLKGQQIEGVGDLAWLNHGDYSLKGVEGPSEICEVGEVGRAVLKPPGNSEKAHKQISSDNDSSSAQHVVVSTRTVFSRPTVRPTSFPPSA